MAKHVLIIGAGIVGVCCGYYLTQAGYRVSIADQSDANHEGCSFGNAGLIVPSHFVPLAAPGMVGTALRMMLNPRSPFYVRPRLDMELLDWGLKFRKAATAERVARAAPVLRDFNLASRACYEQLASLPGADFSLEKNGLLMLCKTRRALDEESHAVEQAGKLGMPAEMLDAKQAAALESGIQMNIAGAVYFPLDCHLSPDRLMTFLRRRLPEAGATFHWNTPITGFRVDGREVKTAQTAGKQELPADEFVLCAGSWSAALARDLNLRLLMQPGKGYSLTLPNPPALPKVPSILTEARVAVTPMNGRLRFGGTMEMSGFNHDIRPRRLEGIIRAACDYFPQFTPAHFAGITPWAGLRPCSPDGLPYLGRGSKHGNLTIATGHAMMGLSLGPITGKLVGQLLEGRPPEIDISLLDPGRYPT